MIDKKILVVEQDVELRSRFYEIFFNKGYQVHCVPTAKEAFAVLMEQRFSIILMNHKLPDGSGIETIKKIREFDEQAFIVLLHDEDIASVQEIELAGLVKVQMIKKDFTNQEMMREILELIRHSDVEEAVPVSAKYTKGSILVVDDNDEIRKTLELFLQKRGYSVRTAVSGEDALLKVRTEKPEINRSAIYPSNLVSARANR